MFAILTLSTSILFSSISAFEDNTASPPNQLSEDKDNGWGIYKEYYEHDYLCDNPLSCQRSSGINTYYGPFIGDNSNYFLERNFECPEGSDATVTISYDVISCGADASKDKSTPFVDLNMGGKNTIGTGSTIITDTVLSENAGYPDSVSCSGDWTTQSITDSSFPTVAGGCRFAAKIRTKLTTNTETAYIANIKVECAATGSQTVTCNADILEANSQHDEYCVDGFTGADAKYNGEYTMYQDNNGNPQEAGTGNKIFVKLHGEVAYIYEETVTLGTDTKHRWVVGTGAGTGAFAYCPLNSASQPFLDVATDCPALTPISHAYIGITEGECADHVTVANVWSLLDEFRFDRDKLLVVMTGLSIFSCFMGMLLCICCQLICRVCKRNKNYEKVVSKELDLDDDYL